MSSLADLVTLVADTLREREVGFALVGGLAVSAHTEPRFTRDVDVAVAVPGDPAAEQVVSWLGPDLRPLAFMEHETLGRLSAVRLGSSHEGDEHTTPVVDLYFAVSGIEPEVVAAAEPVEALPGVTVPLATIGHLIAMKLRSRGEDRPQDDWDLRTLRDHATDEDLAQARQAVQLITERGANRGRDLLADLAALG